MRARRLRSLLASGPRQHPLPAADVGAARRVGRRWHLLAGHRATRPAPGGGYRRGQLVRRRGTWRPARGAGLRERPARDGCRAGHRPARCRPALRDHQHAGGRAVHRSRRVLPRLQLCVPHEEPYAGGWPPGGRAHARRPTPAAFRPGLARAPPARERGGLRSALTEPPHAQGNTRNVGCMEEAATEGDPGNGSGKGDTSGQSPAASGSVAVAAPPGAALDAGGIQLPVWTKVLGWFGIAGLIYLLICAVSIISRGFAGLGGDAAHSMFAFAANPWVGLSVGVLGTVLIQSSTTTTAIAVTAVGSGALPIRGAIPIILGANVGTTVTTTLVALTFIGSRTEFRRALAASTIHDFYNWLALLIFFPIELIWHPLERISGALTNALYGTGWLPDPN